MDARDRLTDERRVFVNLIEDILLAAPGLRYDLHLADVDGDDAPAAGGRRPWAIFTIRTNPRHDLRVTIELTPNDLHLRVNGDAYALGVPGRRLEKWMEKRCRDVERFVQGDIKVEDETLFGAYLSSDLSAGHDGKWTEIAERDDGWGWIGLLGWLLPFGVSPLRTRTVEYGEWFQVDGGAEAPAPDAP